MDYNETYAFLDHFTPIRVLVALCAHQYLEYYQMEFKTAFMNGEAEKDLQMEQTKALKDLLKLNLV